MTPITADVLVHLLALCGLVRVLVRRGWRKGDGPVWLVGALTVPPALALAVYASWVMPNNPIVWWLVVADAAAVGLFALVLFVFSGAVAEASYSLPELARLRRHAHLAALHGLVPDGDAAGETEPQACTEAAMLARANVREMLVDHG